MNRTDLIFVDLKKTLQVDFQSMDGTQEDVLTSVRFESLHGMGCLGTRSSRFPYQDAGTVFIKNWNTALQ